ncbi:hypothetical protein D3C77_320560 [compost metagenome]
MLLALPSPAYILLPAGQVKQARIITESEASVGLSAALFGQAYLALAAHMASTLGDQAPVSALPEPCTVIDVGQFVQDGGQQLFANSAMGASGLLAGSAAVSEARQQLLVQFERRDKRCLAVGILRHLRAPADLDASIQARLEAGRQRLHRFIKQRLAGLLLCRRQAVAFELQLQVRQRRRAQQCQQAAQQPGAQVFHRARMASARSWSLAWRASGTRWRRVSKAASSWAPRMLPLLAT